MKINILSDLKGAWEGHQIEVSSEGKVSFDHRDYFHVFHENEYYLFFINEDNFLYRISYQNERLVLAKASVQNSELTWIHANIDRVCPNVQVDHDSLKRSQQVLKLQLNASELKAFCQNLLKMISDRLPDSVQILQLTGHTLQQAVEEDAERFYQIAFERYREEVCLGLSNIINSDNHPTSLIMFLTDYLRENWITFYPMYFADPDHPVNQALIQLAEKLAELENSGKTAHEFLMPTITNYETSFRLELFKNDLRTLPLAEFLKTHLVDASLTFPLPLALCLNPEPDAENTTLLNPYYEYDFKSDISKGHIMESDWYRLWHHSLLTLTLQDAQESYDKVSHNNSTLLGQINELCEKFGKYGSKDGIGTAKDASESIYPIILSFFNFYDQLSHDDRERVPEPIKNKLEQIRLQHFTQSQNNSENLLAHRNGFLTCISSHRTDLTKLLTKEHENILAQISCSQEKRETQIEEARSYLSSCRDQLKNALADPLRYQIRHKIHVTPTLLEKLRLELNINNFNDLNQLRIFTANELSTLLQKKVTLKETIFRAIDPRREYDNFITFLLTYPSTHITEILGALEDKFSSCFSQNQFNYIRLFNFLETEKLVILLNAIPVLYRQLFFLNFDSKIQMVDRLSDNPAFMKGVINLIQDIPVFEKIFNHILSVFSEEKQRKIFEDIRVIIEKKLCSASDCVIYFECAQRFGKHDNITVDIKLIVSKISNFEELKKIFNIFHDQHRSLIEEIKHDRIFFSRLVVSQEDLYSFFSFLAENFCLADNPHILDDALHKLFNEFFRAVDFFWDSVSDSFYSPNVKFNILVNSLFPYPFKYLQDKASGSDLGSDTSFLNILQHSTITRSYDIFLEYMTRSLQEEKMLLLISLLIKNCYYRSLSQNQWFKTVRFLIENNLTLSAILNSDKLLSVFFELLPPEYLSLFLDKEETKKRLANSSIAQKIIILDTLTNDKTNILSNKISDFTAGIVRCLADSEDLIPESLFNNSFFINELISFIENLNGFETIFNKIFAIIPDKKRQKIFNDIGNFIKNQIITVEDLLAYVDCVELFKKNHDIPVDVKLFFAETLTLEKLTKIFAVFPQKKDEFLSAIENHQDFFPRLCATEKDTIILLGFLSKTFSEEQVRFIVSTFLEELRTDFDIARILNSLTDPESSLLIVVQYMSPYFEKRINTIEELFIILIAIPNTTLKEVLIKCIEGKLGNILKEIPNDNLLGTLLKVLPVQSVCPNNITSQYIKNLLLSVSDDDFDTIVDSLAEHNKTVMVNVLGDANISLRRAIKIAPYLYNRSCLSIYKMLRQNNSQDAQLFLSEIQKIMEKMSLARLEFFINLYQYINWLNEHNTGNKNEKLALLEECFIVSINSTAEVLFSQLKKISGQKKLFTTTPPSFLNLLPQGGVSQEETALAEKIIYSRRTSKGLDVDNMYRIRQLLIRVIEDYLTYHRSRDINQSFVNNPSRLFAQYRHSEKGIHNANELKKNIQESLTPEALIDHIDNFLNSYMKIGGKYDPYACASFILDALSNVFPGSYWEYIADKTVTPAPRSSQLTLASYS